MQDKIQYIADHHGIHSQLIKLVEEMSEVTKEITKLLNATEDKEILDIYRNTLPEELADLSLVYDQVIYLIGCEEQIEEWRQYKAAREARRIRRKQMTPKANNTIINIAKVKCDRCGYQSELEISKVNEENILTNRVDAYSIDFKGQKLEEYSNLKYYICDDCWNDLIDFFDSEEEVEE